MCDTKRTFCTKPEIALDQIRAALSAGISRGIILMYPGHGADTKPRTAVIELALPGRHAKVLRLSFDATA